MSSSAAKKRAVPAEYIRRGRDGIPFGMEHAPKFSPFRSFTLTVDPARWLDLQAGVELAHGHVQAAETLSRRAADLREARQ